MKTEDLANLFRKQVQDLSKPYLWDDDEVFRYLVDAQDTFVRRIGGIPDSTTPKIVDIAVVAATPMADHSPYILRIRSAKLVTAKRALRLISEADVAQAYTDDYGLVRSSYLEDTDTGTVVAAVLGIEKNRIRWFKVPTDDAVTDICRLNVLRLPYPRLTDFNSCLEIDEQHHIHLLKWMKHLAYSKEDAETYDKNLAEQNEQAFERYCDTAKQEEERQRYKPRVVQYGGL